MLLAPFTKYATNGLRGEIVAAAFMQTLVEKGKDVRNDVYGAVDATGLYTSDLARNNIVVTIDAGDRLYLIPDKYIANLYTGQANFRYHYMTAKIGLLPVEYDMTEAATAMAKAISEATGLEVLTKDIFTSVSDKGGITLDDKTATYENQKRAESIEDNKSIYSQVASAAKQADEYKEKYDSLASKYSSISDKISKYT